jgi:hypothetical protein
VKEANRQKSVLTKRYYRISMSCKAHMRLFETNEGANTLGKQAHDCKAQRIPNERLCRCDRDRLKDNALTRG